MRIVGKRPPFRPRRTKSRNSGWPNSIRSCQGLQPRDRQAPGGDSTQGPCGRETSPNKQTSEQKALLKQYPSLNVDRGTVYLYIDDRLTAFNKKWADRTEAVDRKRPAENYIRMCDRNSGTDSAHERLRSR